MVFSYIEKIRRSSPEVRKSYTLFFAIGITAVIVVVYLLSLYLTMLGRRQPEEQKEAKIQEGSQSIQELFESSNVFTKSAPIDTTLRDEEEAIRRFYGSTNQQTSNGSTSASTTTTTPQSIEMNN